MTESLERLLAGSDVEGSPLAAEARVLASMLDDPETRATARVAAAREFREVVSVLQQVLQESGEDRMARFEGRVLRRAG